MELNKRELLQSLAHITSADPQKRRNFVVIISVKEVTTPLTEVEEEHDDVPIDHTYKNLPATPSFLSHDSNIKSCIVK